MSGNPSNEEVQVSPEEQLSIRIAWYYFVTDMTQQQIADRFNTTRVRVNKAIARSRESGVVQIRINSKLAECIRLEYELVQRFGLSEAIVVPTPEEERFIFRVLGVGAAPYIHDLLSDGRSLGVGWGRTLRACARETRGRPQSMAPIISLMGGLNYGSGFNTVEIAHTFSDLFGGQYYFLASPLYVDSPETRNIMLAQEAIRSVYEKARGLDAALVTVGDASSRSLMLELGLVSEATAKSLRAAGAVGEVLGHHLDGGGNPVDHPLNHCVMSLSLEDLDTIDNVVLVAGGMYKAAIIHAVLQRGMVDALVTDEACAATILGMAGPAT